MRSYTEPRLRLAPVFKETVMKQNRDSIQIKLTPEQQEEIRKATGKTAEALELSIMELEERIAPGFRFKG